MLYSGKTIEIGKRNLHNVRKTTNENLKISHKVKHYTVRNNVETIQNV